MKNVKKKKICAPHTGGNFLNLKWNKKYPQMGLNKPMWAFLTIENMRPHAGATLKTLKIKPMMGFKNMPECGPLKSNWQGNKKTAPPI